MKQHVQGSNHILWVLAVLSGAVAIAALIVISQNQKNEKAIDDLISIVDGLEIKVDELKNPVATPSP